MNDTPIATEAVEADLSNLAAEYALGILQGSDRRHFELLMSVNPVLKSFVLKWGSLFGGLDAPAVHAPLPEPSDESIWDRLERRLDTEEHVMSRLHEHQLSVRASLAITIGALRVMRERLAERRDRLVHAPGAAPDGALKH